jgi:molecular chaperone HtpG
LVMDSPLSSHFIQKLEQKAGVSFSRVDADTLDKLIVKDEEIPSKLSDAEKETLKPVFEANIPEGKAQFTIQFENLSETDKPVMITQSEFMRRMTEQQALGGGGMHMMGEMPEMYNMVVNANHPIVSKVLQEKDEAKQKELSKQAIDLALLSNGLLKGVNLTKFINRSLELID